MLTGGAQSVSIMVELLHKDERGKSKLVLNGDYIPLPFEMVSESS